MQEFTRELETIANSNVGLTIKELAELRKTLVNFYIKVDYGGDPNAQIPAEEKVSQVMRDALTRWKKAPEEYIRRVYMKVGGNKLKTYSLKDGQRLKIPPSQRFYMPQVGMPIEKKKELDTDSTGQTCTILVVS